MIEELLAAFAEHGPDVGAEEIADILWLAARVDAAAPSGRAGPPGSGPRPDDEEEALPAPVRHDQPAPREPEEQLFPAGRRQAAGQEREDVQWGVPLRVGRAASLNEPLALMRSLRPIGRRAIGGFGDRLDEQATVERSVEQLLLSPVLLPAESSWLDLALVVDAHHSMLLWADLVDELRRMLTRSGVFRDVRTWYLSGTESGGTPLVAHQRGDPARSPWEIADPSGHRLILVVTDTVAEGWRQGPLHEVLLHWSGHNSVAVLNILPERLWTRAAVRPESLWLRADRPASATRSWRRAVTQPIRPRRRRARASATGTSPVVPMVSASPQSLRRLARLTSGDASWQRMACLSLNPAPASAPDPPAGPRPSAAEAASDALAAVERFRAGASPTAQQLAAYLAAVPLTLPVMTLVRRSMLQESEHGHLAEVALGGLFRPWGSDADETNPEDLTFDFLPGVRDTLLGSQLRSDVETVRDVVRRSVGEYLDRHRGSTREFTATRVVRGGDDRGGGVRDEGVRDKGVRRLVGTGSQPFADRHGVTDGRHDGAGLSGRLVSVRPSAVSGGGAAAGLLLTPRLVLTCLNIPETAVTEPSAVLHVDGRDVDGRVVWREDRTPGAVLVMAEERLLDGRTWAERIPARLRWASLPQPGPASVRIDAFSEVGESVALGGEVSFNGTGTTDVVITAPHPATGWPQLMGAPMSVNGVFTGLIVRRAPEGGWFHGLSARTLLDDEGFREVLRGHMSVPYELDGLLGEATPDRQVSLCAAIEIKDLSVRAGSVPVRTEHLVADRLGALMRAADLDGTVERRGGPGEPDVLVTLNAPFAGRDLGRFLAGLPAELAIPDRFLRFAVAVDAVEVGAGPQGAVGSAMEAAVRTATNARFRSRLSRRAERSLWLAVSPRVRRQIIDFFGPNWDEHFVPFGGEEHGPRDWVWMEDPGAIVQAMAGTEDGDDGRGAPVVDPPWRRCAGEGPEAPPEGCPGRAVEGHQRCLAHLSPEEREDYLATLRPGASVDFSGTTFSGPLLEEFLTAVRDPEGNHVLLGDAVFRRAVFVADVDFSAAEFTGEVSFESATFTQSVSMARALFGDNVTMGQAAFEGDAVFSGAWFQGVYSAPLVAFRGSAHFDQCRFDSDVDFEYGTFHSTEWHRARFGGPSSFSAVTFHGHAAFLQVRFDDHFTLDHVTFEGIVSFGRSSFRGHVSFVTSSFLEPAYFAACQFFGHVSYDNNYFGGVVSWENARFDGSTSFGRTEFNEPVLCGGILFRGDVLFEGTTFRKGMHFRDARFEGAAGFHNIRFDGLADFRESFWARGPYFFGARLTSAPAMLEIPGWEDHGAAGVGVWEIGPGGGPTPPGGPTADRLADLRELVAGARAVIFDFGVICRLFTDHGAADIAEGLLSKAAESGLLVPQLGEGTDDPYAVLRALARNNTVDTAVVAGLEASLAQEELTASDRAWPVPFADSLVRAWPVLGVRLAVMSECSMPMMLRYLTSRNLINRFESRLYGRRPDSRYLDPDPLNLHQALRDLAVPPAETLLITSDPATVSAGWKTGTSLLLGYAPDEERAARLRSAGAATVVPTLEPVLALVRELSEADHPPAAE